MRCKFTFCQKVALMRQQQCWRVRGFPAESGYFNTVAVGCFSCPRVEVTPITWYLVPGMWILPGKPLQKSVFYPPECYFTGGPPRNVIGLVLSNNWVGFVVNTWQPWTAAIQHFFGCLCKQSSAALMNTTLICIIQREDEKKIPSKLFWRQSVPLRDTFI